MPLKPPPSRSSHRQAALAVQDITHLRQISVAFASYASDHEDWFPLRPEDLSPYFEDAGAFGEVFRNPYQERNAPVVGGDSSGAAVRFGGYVFLNRGLNYKDIEDPKTIIHAYTAIVSDKQSTRNVLFADGHTEKWDDEKLRAALPPDVDIDALDGP